MEPRSSVPAARSVPIARVNNAYVFPGVGLGVVAVKARAVSDEMLTAAATAVAQGLAPPMSDDEVDERIEQTSWSPVYRDLVDDPHP